MALDLGPTIPLEVSLVAHEEQGSLEQLQALMGIFATSPCISVRDFRSGYVRLMKEGELCAGPDPVLANLAYIEGRRSEPILPPGVTIENFIGLVLRCVEYELQTNHGIDAPCF